MDDTAARRARRFIDEFWCAQHSAVLRGHAHVIASELVTLAVHHGQAPVRMSIECDAEAGAVVSVSDGDPNAPDLVAAAQRTTGGRRLMVVSVLSDDWGVTTRPGGKTIWSRLIA